MSKEVNYIELIERELPELHSRMKSRLFWKLRKLVFKSSKHLEDSYSRYVTLEVKANSIKVESYDLDGCWSINENSYSNEYSMKWDTGVSKEKIKEIFEAVEDCSVHYLTKELELSLSPFKGDYTHD